MSSRRCTPCLVLCSLLWACASDKPDDSGTPAATGTTGSTGSTGSTGTTGTTDAEPQDDDRDGYTSDVDCDDRDPLTHPGATEAYNAVDDDCDGRVDANGRYSGVLDVSATAIVDGETFSFTLVCPATLTRDGGEINAAATCTPDPEDDVAQALLGASLTVSMNTETASQDTWTGSGTLASSAGWDARLDAALTFADFSAVAWTTQLDGVSLDLSAEGTLTVE